MTDMQRIKHPLPLHAARLPPARVVQAALACGMCPAFPLTVFLLRGMLELAITGGPGMHYQFVGRTSLLRNSAAAALGVVLTFNLAGCYENASPSPSPAPSASGGSGPPADLPVTDFESARKKSMVMVDYYASTSTTIRRAVEQANIKDAKLDGLLKQIDTKVADLRSRVAKISPDKGVNGLLQVERWVSDSNLYMLCEEAQTRSQELLNKGRPRGQG